MELAITGVDAESPLPGDEGCMSRCGQWQLASRLLDHPAATPRSRLTADPIFQTFDKDQRRGEKPYRSTGVASVVAAAPFCLRVW